MSIGVTIDQSALTVLIDPSVELRLTGVPEEDLIITAEFSETSLTMEVKLYTNSEVLTPEPLTCNIAGHTPHSCIFKVEPDVTDFKILLMALDIDSTVTESTVVEFEGNYFLSLFYKLT